MKQLLRLRARMRLLSGSKTTKNDLVRRAYQPCKRDPPGIEDKL